jgi:hypothetical protein
MNKPTINDIFESDLFLQGWAEGYKRNRIETFAAIRRAAEIARWHDVESKEPWLEEDIKEDYEWCADQIRVAIRVAIGPEKA